MKIDVANKYNDDNIVYACDNMTEAEDIAQYISKETGCGTKITVDDELGAAIIRIDHASIDGINCDDWSNVIRHNEDGTLQVFAKNIDGKLDWIDVVSATALLFRQHPVDEYIQREQNDRNRRYRHVSRNSVIIGNDTHIIAATAKSSGYRSTSSNSIIIAKDTHIITELHKQEKIYGMPRRARIITHKDDINNDNNIRVLLVTYKCSDCLTVNGEMVHTGDVVYTMDNKAITIGARVHAYVWHDLDTDTEHLYSYLVDLEGKKVHGAIKKTLWSNQDRMDMERGTKETKMTILKLLKSLLGIG